MQKRFETYKTIPIGKIIRRDLQKRGISQIHMSRQIGISYSHLNAIINGHRNIGSQLSQKIESMFDYEPHFLQRIQTYQKEQQSIINSIILTGEHPSIRNCVFWDIDMSTLDWKKNRSFIIKRVSRYGNTAERAAVNRFYSILTA